MTYTADDFAVARFATHPSGRSTALRAYPHSISPWLTAPEETDALATRLSDARLAEFGWVPVQETPRPLTAGDITDEMVERAQHKIQLRATRIPAETIRLALVAALTEPTRPEGAEEIEKILGSWPLSDALGRHFTADALGSLADHIAKETNR